MKVVHFSTSVGESSANIKLQRALQKEGVDSLTIVKSCSCTDAMKDVELVRISIWGRVIHQLHKIWAKAILKKYNLPEGIPFSLGKYGIDVSKIKAVEEADILHIHWICDFLSPPIVAKLVETGKPIVWTCHDSWPFTGGCHVRLGCEKYELGCGECPILGSSKKEDVSRMIMQYKLQHLLNRKITFIAPSRWTGAHVSNSLLFRDNKCVVIPNTLDIKVFSARTQEEIAAKLQYTKEKNKIHILFGAVSVRSPYKGYEYLKEMLQILYDTNKELANRIVLHVVGNKDDAAIELLNYSNVFWGYIQEPEKMACLYSMADVLIYPSLEESLGYVVMECLACSTPAVVFEAGGIPDLVEHKINGYIAQYKNSEDLLEGLLWILDNNENNCLGINGRKKVIQEFDEKIVAKQHIALYKSLLAERTNNADKSSRGGT